MKTRTEIINELIAKNGFQSYLEIGLGDGVNFSKVNCWNKVGVDPEWSFSEKYVKGGQNIFSLYSDEFFENQKEKFELIFIDGLHHSDQVEKDIVNAYSCLNQGGVILLHDCNPWDEKIQRVPRESVAWTGDVWKAVFGFIDEYGEKIKTEYIPERAGIFAIWKTGRYKVTKGFNKPELDWGYFVENKGTYYGR